jgi:hypothetical protein
MGSRSARLNSVLQASGVLTRRWTCCWLCASKELSTNSAMGTEATPRAQLSCTPSKIQRGKKSTPTEAVCTQRNRPGQSVGR